MRIHGCSPVMVLVACVLAACPRPATQCTADAECSSGESCVDGTCGPAQTASSSSSGAGSVGSSSRGSTGSSTSNGATSVVRSSSAGTSTAASASSGNSTSAGGSSASQPASTSGAVSSGQSSSNAASMVPSSSSGPPPTQSRLGVAVRTGLTPNAGTDDPIRFCLGAQCQSLNIPSFNDRQNREVDVYTFTIPYTPRASVPLVALETTAGTDAWRPICLQVVLDGETIYCRELSGLLIGNSAGETTRFEDTTLQVDCSTCLYGAMVGDTTQDTSQMWMRVPGAQTVSVQYDTVAPLTAARETAPASPVVDDDYTAHVTLTGLTPATTYHYRVMVDGIPFHGPTLPTFHTAPAGATSFVTAFGSCADDRDDTAAWAEMPIYNHVRSHAPDLMLMIGDNHYANVNLVADHTAWLAELRAHYRKTRTYRSFMDLVSRTPTYAIWDDHDFLGNNTNGVDFNMTDRGVALQGFREFWANPAYGSGGTPGVWHSFVYGDVEFFMLDNRYWRAAPGGTMLGAQQLAWLISGLAASTASFKVIASGSIWHTGPTDDDSWGEHNAERETIIQSIADNRVSGVFFLGGDVHRAGDWQVPTAVTGVYPLYEFVNSGLAQATTACGAVGATEVRFSCVGGSQYFGLLRFVTSGAAPSVTYEIRDAANALVHSRQVDLSTLQLP